MKVAILICDGGDGSASLSWFKNIDLAKTLCDKYEEYYQNEGGPEVVEVQSDFNPPFGFSDYDYLENGDRV